MDERKFSFGKNWQIFLKSLTDKKIDRAIQSLRDFLSTDNLESKTFIDIGCGSGLFSYAAYRLGAKKVISIDADPFSTGCCRFLHHQANNPQNWEIHDGSVLDNKFLDQFDQFDIVYSWGVLHHTGNMIEAIKNSAGLVQLNGYYYISIYNRKDGLFNSCYWLRIKQFYNRSPKIIKLIMEYSYMLKFIIAKLCRLKNPMNAISSYYSKRGMNWRADIRDWLGGYPYEFATPGEIVEIVYRNFPSFQLIRLETNSEIGCNSFLFKRII